MHETAIVILAAGQASRMGTPKQLLVYRDRPLVRHAAEQALASQAREVTVVVGAHADALKEALEGLAVNVVENPDWERGMGTSIRTGVGHAAKTGVHSVLLTLADQPELSASLYNNLMGRFAAVSEDIVTASYAGTVGVPVVFGRRHFDALLSLGEAEGCKGLILRNLSDAIQVDCPEAEADIDTPADYAALVLKPS